MARFFAEPRWAPYVNKATRLANTARETEALRKKGKVVSPVRIEGRTIATTVWGKAWCDVLESYSDYDNRLPRGRTYVRNGSVVDLQVKEGLVEARVSGSSMYRVSISFAPVTPARWNELSTACAGKVGSLLELLQGKVSSEVMAIMTRRDAGLFPDPSHIKMSCSCPDWADMCKHVAAVLYGVGNRLDSSPELLFTLRSVDPTDLITTSTPSVLSRSSSARKLSPAALSDVFGIDLSDGRMALAEATASIADSEDGIAVTPPASPSRRTPSRAAKPSSKPVVTSAKGARPSVSSRTGSSTPARTVTQSPTKSPRPTTSRTPAAKGARPKSFEKGRSSDPTHDTSLVTKAELQRLGVPASMVESWLRGETLSTTEASGVYRMSDMGRILVDAWRSRAK